MSRVKGDELATPILDRQNLRGGLSIRAELAKAAMQGILSNGHEGMPDHPDAVSKLAVQHADALINALNADQQ